MTKQVVGFGMAVMTTLLLLLVLWQIRIVVIYVLISLILAAVMRPLINNLVRRGVGGRIAWVLMYLVVMSGFGFFLFLSGEAAINEIQKLAQSVLVQDDWRLPLWLDGSSFQQLLVERLPTPSKLFEAVTGDKGQLVLPAILGFSRSITGLVSGTLIVLLLSIYWSINQIHFERLWLSLLPSGQRKQVRGIWQIVEPDLGAYIRSQVVLSLLTGVLLAPGYWLLGSPFPALLALTGALASLVPVVGPALVVLPVLLVGLLTSVQHSLFTAFYAIVVLIALGLMVKPRLFNRMWDNPILTVVLLITLADAFGLVGLIIAPPLSVFCQILWSRLVSHRDVSGAGAQVSDLKERLEHVGAFIQVMDEPPPPLVTSSMERLTFLMEKAEPILQAALLAGPSEQLTYVMSPPEQEEPFGGTQNG